MKAAPVLAWWTLRSRDPRLELIDGPVESRAELEASFGDIRLANRRFGGIAAARAALRGIDAATVLDVGCGIADIPFALRDERRSTTFTCLDENAALIEAARTRYAGASGMRFVVGDGKALPFADASFDVVMCNLALHHFAEDEAIALLREMRRVARLTPVVTDLRRSIAAWIAAFAFSRLFTRNRLTRHDAPLSARRAYTPAEALQLARRAGWRRPRVRIHNLIRLVLSDDAAR